MPEFTYIVRFVKRDGNVETWEHVKEVNARVHFNLFDATDADIYSEIQLIQRAWWPQTKDRLLDEKRFTKEE